MFKTFVFYITYFSCTCAQSLQSCLSLCNPMDCSPPGSCVHGIFQATILEQVAISFSRGPSGPRDRTASPALQTDCLPSVTILPANIIYFPQQVPVNSLKYSMPIKFQWIYTCVHAPKLPLQRRENLFSFSRNKGLSKHTPVGEKTFLDTLT